MEKSWREKALFLFWSGVAAMILGSLFLALRQMKKIEIKGYENLPEKEGNIVLASNHPSMVETILIPLLVVFKSFSTFLYFLKNPFQVVPWSTPDEFWVKIMPFLRHLHCLPIRNQRVDARILKEAAGVLERKGILVLFVEGGRTGRKKEDRHFYFLDKGTTKERRIRRPRFGVGSLVIDAHPKVIPIWVEGVVEVMPIGSPFPNFFGKKRITIIIGEPINFSSFNVPSEENKKRISANISKRVAEEILTLARQTQGGIN